MSQAADCYPPATMEDAAIAAEERYYGNLSSTAAAKPSGFDSDTGNHKVSKLNYSDAARRIGPNALLRVMSGDRVSISVDAFYSSAGQDNSNSSWTSEKIEEPGYLIPTDGILMPHLQQSLFVTCDSTRPHNSQEHYKHTEISIKQ